MLLTKHSERLSAVFLLGFLRTPQHFAFLEAIGNRSASEVQSKNYIKGIQATTFICIFLFHLDAGSKVSVFSPPEESVLTDDAGTVAGTEGKAKKPVVTEDTV